MNEKIIYQHQSQDKQRYIEELTNNRSTIKVLKDLQSSDEVYWEIQDLLERFYKNKYEKYRELERQCRKHLGLDIPKINHATQTDLEFTSYSQLQGSDSRYAYVNSLRMINYSIRLDFPMKE